MFWDLNKKLLGVVITLIVLFTGSVSALEFDNCGQYDEETKTMTIINAFCYGGTIAKITLLSPYEVHVLAGEERLVAWYEIENFQEYDGREVFDTIQTINLKTGQPKNKNMKFKMENEEETRIISAPNYETTCTPISYSNGTEGEQCESIQTGSITQKIHGWKAFNKDHLLPVGNITIGLFTDVEENENVDWIPNMYGVTINEWAIWNETFNASLIHRYKFDESIGENASDEIDFNNNITINLGNFSSGGVVGNMLNYSEIGEINGTSLFNAEITGNHNRTVSFWSYTNGISDAGTRSLFGWGGPGAGTAFYVLIVSGDYFFYDNQEGSINTGVAARTGWIMHTITTNGTGVKYYLNGTLVGSSSNVNLGTTATQMLVGQRKATTANYNGTIDELVIWNRTLADSEISDLYDTEFGSMSTIGVALDSPADGFGTIETTNFFSADFTFGGVGNFTNSTLFVWNPDNSLFGVNRTNITGTSNSSNMSLSGFVIANGYQWNYYACGIDADSDPFCEFAASNRTFDIDPVRENSQTFNNETIEGNLETFRLNLTYDSSLFDSITADLVYNNTASAGARLGTGDEIVFVGQATAPGTDSVETTSFYWEVSLTDSGNENLFNSTFNNQSVSNYSIDNCTTNSVEILNFSVVDETEQTPLISDYEIATNVYNFDRQVLLSNFSISGNASGFSICANIGQLNNTFVLLDTVVRYTAEDYAVEHYNIDNSTIDNETLVQRIILFDLTLNESTEFQLTFTGADFLPEEGALVIVEREYIKENVFKTVEIPKTDANGQAVLHLIRNDAIYNIRIVKGGTVIGNFETITAFCEDFTIGNCKIILNSKDSTQAIFNYDSDLGIIFETPTFNNNTGVVQFSFLTADGLAKTVLMEVTRNDILGNRTLCQDSLTSAAGTLSCNTGTIDESLIRVTVSVDGTEAIIVQFQTDSSGYGAMGFFIFFIMAISMILMFSSSKSGVLWAIFISTAGAIGLGLVSGNLYGLGASGLWLALILVLGLWKLNKRRQQ